MEVLYGVILESFTTPMPCLDSTEPECTDAWTLSLPLILCTTELSVTILFFLTDWEPSLQACGCHCTILNSKMAAQSQWPVGRLLPHDCKKSAYWSTTIACITWLQLHDPFSVACAIIPDYDSHNYKPFAIKCSKSKFLWNELWLIGWLFDWTFSLLKLRLLDEDFQLLNPFTVTQLHEFMCQTNMHYCYACSGTTYCDMCVHGSSTHFTSWKGQHSTTDRATNTVRKSAKRRSMLPLTTVWLAAGD